MANVFLSYATADAPFANRLSSALRQLGVRTSNHEEVLRAGDDWENALRDSLRAADGVVLVASDSALESAWAMFEFGAAMAAGKRVIPVRPPGRQLHDELSVISRRHILETDGLSEIEIAARVSQRLDA